MEDVKAQFNELTDKVSQRLAERSAELDRRAEALDRREADLDRRERELNEKIAIAEQAQRCNVDLPATTSQVDTSASRPGEDPSLFPRDAMPAQPLFKNTPASMPSSIAGRVRAANLVSALPADDEEDDKTATTTPAQVAQSRLFSVGVDNRGDQQSAPTNVNHSTAKNSSLFGDSASTGAKTSLFGAPKEGSLFSSQVHQKVADDDNSVDNSCLQQAPTPARAHSSSNVAAPQEDSVDTNRLRQMFEKKPATEGEAPLTRRKTWTPVMKDVPLPPPSSSVADSDATTTASTGEHSAATVKVNIRTGDGGIAYRPKTVINKAPPKPRSLQELLSADEAKAKEGV